MRKQLSYNDDLSLLGQRVHPIEPRTTNATSSERYRLYSPTSGEHHQKLPRLGASEITYTPAKSKVTTSKPPAGSKPTYALKINTLDCVIPVVNPQLMRIEEACSVLELQRLLNVCTGSPSAAATAGRVTKPPSRSTFSTARTAGVQVYERCFLQHCTTLRDALGD